MKILSAEQIREADKYTIENEPIKSIDLMERASRAFVLWFESNFNRDRNVYIFCGTGNNGGDGMAIGRILSFRKWTVKTITVKKSAKRSQDFTINYLKLAEVRQVDNIEKKADLNFNINENSIVIDAIFGSGLVREIKGIYAEVIDFLNNTGATIISVDVPSGLFIDTLSPKKTVIKADHVLSFQLPKLAFLVPENSNFIKNWSIANIGLDQDFINAQQTNYEYIDHDFVGQLIRPRRKFDHKTNFGRIMLMSGSYGKMGACILCAKASMKAGAGLVTAHIPKCGYDILQTTIPEVMTSTDFEKRFLTAIPELDPYDAIGIGPGIGQNIDTYEVIAQLLDHYHKPIVFDADAINIIADEQSFMRKLPEGSILTPHPGEFKRLVGFWNDDFERLEQQIAISKEFKTYIVLKGAHTSISTPEGKVYFNSTGNPGMATGGSGDVLTGIITALLGQQYPPEHAAVLGVYLHGLAADLAVEQLGEEGLIASDIIDYLPKAFNKVKNQSGKFGDPA
ncbi:MAG: NAD(P)H-hydrate dehydratase [Cytophagales bacterium]|nr:NAD(P)H-hydrate dehydratase [Cytophagales bacterium]